MKLTGKRTYILAVICAIGIAYLWYRTQDTDALFGLIPSSLMFGMRKITGNSILNECNQLLKSNTGDVHMGFGLNIMSISKTIADLTGAVDAINKVAQKYANDPDVMDMTAKTEVVIGDLGLSALLQIKK
jgi:hypothetical protein